MMFSMIFVLLTSGLGGLLERPPQDWASLLDPKSVLTEMGEGTDEDALIKRLDSNAITTVAGDRLKQASNDLAADDFKTRRRAKRLLELAGPTAIPFLEEAAKSDDPEQKLSAQELLDKAIAARVVSAENGDEIYVQKLMAIHLLATMKSQKAIPSLTVMATNTAPTLAYAAMNAIRLIEGKSELRPDVTPILADLVQRLPENAAFAGLLDLSTGSHKATFVELMAELLKHPELANLAQQSSLAQFRSAVPKELTKLLGKTGNVRVDAIQLIVSKDLAISRNAGYLGFVFKGLYEVEMMQAELKRELRKTYEYEGHTVLFTNDVAVACLDKNTLVLAVSERNDGRQIEAILKAMSGKVEAVSMDLLAKRHPAILPGLSDVLAGKDRIGVGGALSDAQRACSVIKLQNDMNRNRRMQARANPKLQLELNMMTVAKQLVDVNAYTATVLNGKRLRITAKTESDEKAGELKDAMMLADASMRDVIKLRKERIQNAGMPAGMKKLFDNLDTPLGTISHTKSVVTVEAEISRFLMFALGM